MSTPADARPHFVDTPAHRHRKRVFHLSRSGGLASPGIELLRFIHEHDIRVLNVAGPGASKEPGIAVFVKATLEALCEEADDFGVESGMECWQLAVVWQTRNTQSFCGGVSRRGINGGREIQTSSPS